AHLVEHGPAGHVAHAADDHVADLALGVAADHGEHLAETHSGPLRAGVGAARVRDADLVVDNRPGSFAARAGGCQGGTATAARPGWAARGARRGRGRAA